MFPRLGAVFPPTLVGRARERALLAEAFASASLGHGGLVLVAGEAGIGKTALAEDLCRSAAALGGLVLIGRAYDLTETPPFGPWVELFAGYPRDAELPELPDVVAKCGTTGGAPSREALFEQIRLFLRKTGAVRPLVLVLDDLHWADQDSLDLLRSVSRDLPTVPCLIIATYRADELSVGDPLYLMLPALVRESHASRVALRPLDGDDIWALIRDRYRLPAAAEARLSAYLFGNAEGNPFFTGELVHTLEEEGMLRRLDGGWELGDLNRVHLPALVEQVVGGRLARLGESAQRLLGIAAVIGQEIPLALWASVASEDEEALLDLLDRAGRARLLQEDRDGHQARFAHALIRHALYEGISPARRRAWHRLVGETLATIETAEPEVVAHHFHQAADERAYAWWIKAGERAQRSHSWLTAADRFERGLTFLDARNDDDAQRGWLLFRLALLRRYPDPRLGITRLNEAARQAGIHNDRPLGAYARFFRGLLRCYIREVRAGLDDMGAGLAEVAALPTEERARLGRIGIDLGVPPDSISGVYSLWLGTVGRYEESRAAGEETTRSEAPPAAVGNLDGFNYADAYSGLLRAYAAQGEPEAAMAAFAQACSLYRSVAHDSQLARTLIAGLSTVVLPFYADELIEREVVCNEAEQAVGRAGGLVQGAIPPRAVRLALLRIEGGWTELRSLASELRLVAREQGAYMNFSATELGLLARCQGDTALAWQMVREVVPAGPAEEPGGAHQFYAQAMQRLAASLALDAGDLPRARTWLEAHDRWLVWSGAVLGRAEGYLAWAEYHLAAGSHRLARNDAELAHASATVPRQPLPLLAAHRLLGEIDTSTGRYRDASEHLGHALALATACAAPYERALTLLATADLRRAAGAFEDVAPVLAEARSILYPLGAAAALARLAALTAWLDGAASKGTAENRHGSGALAALSPREIDVLRLLAGGHTNQEIGDALHISVKTVENHVTRVLTKADLRNRAAAAAFAQRHGLT